MKAIIILSIAAAAGWLLWSHWKKMAADDFKREIIRRASNSEARDREDYDGKLK